MESTSAITFRKVLGRRFAGIALVVLAVVAGGAVLLAGGSAGPWLRAEASSYGPGDPVDLQLRNGLLPAGHNLCFAFLTLQAYGAEGWGTVTGSLEPPDGGLIACTGELRPLAPFGGAHATVHLPSDLPPGDYRVVHELEVRGDRRAVATDAFTVGVRGG